MYEADRFSFRYENGCSILSPPPKMVSTIHQFKLKFCTRFANSENFQLHDDLQQCIAILLLFIPFICFTQIRHNNIQQNINFIFYYTTRNMVGSSIIVLVVIKKLIKKILLSFQSPPPLSSIIFSFIFIIIIKELKSSN